MSHSPDLASPNFDGTRFFNPNGPATDRSFRELLRWRLDEKSQPWPPVEDVTPVIPVVRVSGVRVTSVGHCTFLIQAGGLNILTDPVWSEKAGPLGLVGPRRYAPPGIRFEDLPPIHAVLLSHNHYDHLDLPTLKRLDRRDGPLVVTPLGNDAVIRPAMPRARIEARDWGGSVPLGEGVAVHVVPANHWSARTPWDRRRALWGGFVIVAGGVRIHFVGDTGYGGGTIFRHIRERHGMPDLALIPIGAYEPRWFMEPQHCNPEEAVQIMLDLGAGRALGMHWGTFKLTAEPRDEPAERLGRCLLERSIGAEVFPAARVGQVFDF